MVVGFAIGSVVMLHIILCLIPILLMVILFRWRWKTARTQPHPNALMLIGAMETLCDTQDYGTDSDYPKNRGASDIR